MRSLVDPFGSSSESPQFGRFTELPGVASEISHKLGNGPHGEFRLVLNRGEPWALQHRGETTIETGDAVLIDVRVSHRVEITTAIDVARMELPESWLEHWVPNARDFCGWPIAKATPWGDTLTIFLEQLAYESDVGRPPPVSSVSQQVGVLLALFADAAWGSRPLESDVSDIRNAISHRCFDHALTVHAVASSLAISSRTLHRTLAREGTSFGRILVGARLVMARRMLEAPLFGRLTTAEIGARAGFTDPSHFARAYRRAWGISPAKARSAIKVV